MEVELIEIRQFLEQRNPFFYLASELLDELPRDIEIRYLRRGSAFPPQDGFLYIVRSGAIEIFDEDDELCEKLAEGDLYSVSCQLVNLSQCSRGEASEDALLYMLSCTKLKALCRASPAFSEHFSASVKERLKSAVSTIQESADPSVATMMVEVGSLIRKPPITVASGMTIRQTAALMSNKDVSSVMVMQDDDLIGLVTDRDLRKRCVAIGLTGNEPINHDLDGMLVMPSQLQIIAQRNNLTVHTGPQVSALQQIFKQITKLPLLILHDRSQNRILRSFRQLRNAVDDGVG